MKPEDIHDVRDILQSSRADLIELAPQITWYHTIDFGDGFVVNGEMDIRPHLHRYKFPPLTGKRVLDVGRSSGFFAFQFA